MSSPKCPQDSNPGKDARVAGKRTERGVHLLWLTGIVLLPKLAQAMEGVMARADFELLQLRIALQACRRAIRSCKSYKLVPSRYLAKYPLITISIKFSPAAEMVGQPFFVGRRCQRGTYLLGETVFLSISRRHTILHSQIPT